MKEKYNIKEFCLCGSGKIYSKCCEKKIDMYKDKSSFKRYMSEFDKMHKNYKKICLHPNQSECGEKVHAHTISQKAVLELIAENGQVLMPIVFGVENKFRMQPLGIEARATKFYCFCKEHDKIFYPIDQQGIDFSDEIYFLYAYRNFSSEYYKLKRELDCYYKLRETYDLTKNPMAILEYMKMQRNMYFLGEYKEMFDNYIVNKTYDCLVNVRIPLDYRVQFAVATCLCPLIDIVGDDMYNEEERIALLFVSIIPDKDYTNIIFSWFKKDAERYSDFEEQLKCMPTRFILKYLNNLLPLSCENMTVSPKLWNAWGKEGQEEFTDIAYGHLTKKNIKLFSKTYFTGRKYNLFMKNIIDKK